MITPTDDLISAAFTARHWHDGQACPLYALSCGQWDELTRDDIDAARRAFGRIAWQTTCESDDDLDMLCALDALEAWLAANP